MKIHLLFPDSEFDSRYAYANKSDICKDLNMEILFKTMAREDAYIGQTVRNVMMYSVADERGLLYRQEVVRDACDHMQEFEEIYRIATEAQTDIIHYKEANERRGIQPTRAGSIFAAMEMLNLLFGAMSKLKAQMDATDTVYTSYAMRQFCERLRDEYSRNFEAKLKESIDNMRFLAEGGRMTLSMNCGAGLKADKILVNDLCRYQKKKKRRLVEWAKRWYIRLFCRNCVLLEDTKLIENTHELTESGLQYILKIYEEFIRTYRSFFERLRYQIAFYVGCANLYHRFSGLHIPLCMPVIMKSAESVRYEGLYDMSMAAYMRHCPVTNSASFQEKRLYIITGANQGGKSTFLRSFGLAQVMMQCGMYVPATKFVSGLHHGIFTHFTRREDAAMNSGRLEEELKRMDRILNNVQQDSLVLLNESFATTTEKEGAILAQDITTALYEAGITVMMVTHLYEYSCRMYEKMLPASVFMSAERREDGTRTFRILEGKPSMTSYGLDLYEDIIGKDL